MDKDIKGLIIIGNRHYMYRIIAFLALLWGMVIGVIWLIWKIL
jgi:hypothetical protein